jgi:hypothetical protein
MVDVHRVRVDILLAPLSGSIAPNDIADRRDDFCRNLILDSDGIPCVALVTLVSFRPQVIPVARIDQLCRNNQSVSILANASFKDGAHAMFATETAQVHSLVAVLKHCGASRYPQTCDAGETCREIFRESVTESLR